jgi:NAD+ synthase
MSNTSSVLGTVVNQDYGQVMDRLNSFLHNYLASSRANGVVIGLSGGLDSSVAAAACTQSLGTDRVFGLVMPTKVTPDQDRKDAVSLAQSLGIGYATVKLDEIIDTFSSTLPNSQDKKIMGNLTARLRMLILYYYAGVKGNLVGGTSDRSELLIGYFTKFGDGSADLQPIASLYKSQVRAFGRHLGIPEEILEKKSSPRLWPDHVAEKEIGIDYDTIDCVLYLLVDRKLDLSEISTNLKIDPKVVEKIKSMIDSSTHKRQGAQTPSLV